ncbi:MAG TPA: NAD(+) diphosphatase [Cellvibrio sp.]|nr:NAD(+) diphosphatase [Cellvibrio sp.]
MTVQSKKHFYLVAREQLLCAEDGRLNLFQEELLANLPIEILSQHLVHKDEQRELWVAAITPEVISGYSWLSLRAQVGAIDEEQFQLAGRALQLLRWHYDHQFCGRCGRPTVPHLHDLAKTCVSCQLDVYPRLSPCIITLVVKGDYCLLAQHQRSTNQTYSCLAGFIEMGETPEQTLLREVKEEVNLRVDNIRYVTSQPWPFPGQLMLGYFADYAEGDIVVEQQEILRADWFRYDQLPKVPSLATISGRLIDTFVQQRAALHFNKN